MTAVLVVIGAMVGAPLRYLTDRAIKARYPGLFPWGTFTVNLAGCLLLGALTGAGAAIHALVGTGLCGALTTYSTFSYETLHLIERKAYRHATLNVVASIAAAVLAAATTGVLVG